MLICSGAKGKKKQSVKSKFEMYIKTDFWGNGINIQ